MRRYPDLLIHEYLTRSNQKLIIEVKKGSASLSLLKKDLAKLAVYCHGRLSYKKGVLLLINPNNNKKEAITADKSIKDLLSEYSKIEIWIINYDKKIEIIKNQ